MDMQLQVSTSKQRVSVGGVSDKKDWRRCSLPELFSLVPPVAPSLAVQRCFHSWSVY